MPPTHRRSESRHEHSKESPLSHRLNYCTKEMGKLDLVRSQYRCKTMTEHHYKSHSSQQNWLTDTLLRTVAVYEMQGHNILFAPGWLAVNNPPDKD
ncbi:hypothetical protein ElyMa_006892400 [Elysia marginata]|uniref:Uncharacterized protein n=1 Tax=Elysia marginata TaxID=1093978 RepID=A0AAV4JGP4_9GAST|nr:hypothetical protein ElyMa_006892400 [Elysia marginata]